jgi:hypothetical protein
MLLIQTPDTTHAILKYASFCARTHARTHAHGGGGRGMVWQAPVLYASTYNAGEALGAEEGSADASERILQGYTAQSQLIYERLSQVRYPSTLRGTHRYPSTLRGTPPLIEVRYPSTLTGWTPPLKTYSLGACT